MLEYGDIKSFFNQCLVYRQIQVISVQFCEITKILMDDVRDCFQSKLGKS